MPTTIENIEKINCYHLSPMLELMSNIIFQFTTLIVGFAYNRPDCAIYLCSLF